MTIENESGSTAYMPVTRDAIAGKGPFNVDGVFMGSPRYDGGRGFYGFSNDITVETHSFVPFDEE